MLKKLLSKLAGIFTLKRGLMILVPLLVIALVPELAHAAADPTDTELEVYQKIGATMSMLLNFVQSLLWPFLVFIGDLMDADLIIGPGMEESIWAIWVQLRDLVNICFVIVLLVIAFYNTLGIGGGEGNLAMKTALPKVIIGIILVNFTFTAGKVVIDVSNVATTAVFALPEMVDTFDMDVERQQFAQNVCVKGEGEHFKIDKDAPALTQLFCEKGKKSGDNVVVDPDGDIYLHTLSQKAEQTYFQRLNKSNISIVMAANMGAINSQELLKPEAIEGLDDLLENLTFSLFMSFIFAVSYVVLGIVLIARVVVLWVALAFSPVAVLVFVVPQLKDWLGGGGDAAQKVIKHLIAPIIIGIVMTIGYIMINAWDGNIANTTLSIGGSESKELLASSLLLSGVADLSHLIIAVASIVVVWSGVFAASSDTIASFATEAIKGVGTSVGKAALKAPLAAASIPISYTDSEGKEQQEKLSALDIFSGAKMAAASVGDPYASQAKFKKIFPGSRLFDRAGPGESAKGKEQLYDIRQKARGGVDSNDLTEIQRRFEAMAKNKELSTTGLDSIRAEISAVRAGDSSMRQLASTIQDSERHFDLDEDGKSEFKQVVRDIDSAEYTGRTDRDDDSGTSRRQTSGGAENRRSRDRVIPPAATSAAQEGGATTPPVGEGTTPVVEPAPQPEAPAVEAPTPPVTGPPPITDDVEGSGT